MKYQHLLRVERPADAFAPLIAAVGDAGGRTGWLDLEPPEVPPSLEPAAAAGVLRAVAVGGGRSVAVKPMRGAPVLRDLLREHFRGTAVVLVRGAEDDVPLLEPEGDDWRLRLAGTTRSLTTAELVAALRRPRPWGPPEEPPPAEEPAGPKRRRERRAEMRAERAKAKRRKKRS